MQQQRDNEGAIWRNDDRKTDKHPHFKGSATIGGKEFWVSAWKRDPEGNPKAPALKFALTPKDERKQDRPMTPHEAAQAPGWDKFDKAAPEDGEEIPF